MVSTKTSGLTINITSVSTNVSIAYLLSFPRNNVNNIGTDQAISFNCISSGPKLQIIEQFKENRFVCIL